jgi:hypothetical protein
MAATLSRICDQCVGFNARRRYKSLHTLSWRAHYFIDICLRSKKLFILETSPNFVENILHEVKICSWLGWNMIKAKS